MVGPNSIWPRSLGARVFFVFSAAMLALYAYTAYTGPLNYNGNGDDSGSPGPLTSQMKGPHSTRPREDFSDPIVMKPKPYIAPPTPSPPPPPPKSNLPPLQILWWNSVTFGERFFTVGGNSNPKLITDCNRDIKFLYADKKTTNLAPYDAVLFSFPTVQPWEVGIPTVKPPNQTWIAFSVENTVYMPTYTREYLLGLKMDKIISYDTRSEFWYTRLSKQYIGTPKNGIEEFRTIRVPFESKIKKVAMLYANCKTTSRREDYIRKLMQYYPFDSFGQCMHNTNDRTPAFLRTEDDFQAKIGLTASYMFTMSMENGYTDDYVSEKLFQALLAGSIPIYQGAPNVYDFIPEHSIIQTSDFKNESALGEYLNKVANDENLYNSYMAWKKKPFPEHFVRVWNHSLDHFDCFICQTLAEPTRRCPFNT